MVVWYKRFVSSFMLHIAGICICNGCLRCAGPEHSFMLVLPCSVVLAHAETSTPCLHISDPNKSSVTCSARLRFTETGPRIRMFPCPTHGISAVHPCQIKLRGALRFTPGLRCPRASGVNKICAEIGEQTRFAAPVAVRLYLHSAQCTFRVRPC